MTHPPPLPASDAPPPDSPRRAWTILGRLSKAVREQNWFAVALEVVIVIVGVVIGFQVTSWGQARADRATEQTYLRQLAADLAETERIVAERDARMDAATHAGLDRLLRSFDAPQRPPADSVAAWLRQALYVASPRPVLGTAEALVATGDLRLLADDALRAAVLRYLDASRENVGDQADARDVAFDVLFGVLYRDHVDIRTVGSRTYDDGRPTFWGALPALSPTAPWQPPFPLDVDALYSDPAFYRALGMYGVAIGELGRSRLVMREEAAALRQRVETAIVP
ncbi:hypothetical protein [Rubrivirga sp. IMCC45206]|uniref:hypothetical protein n=1 Tax=Rubrivirga sp. IMCC45206 TaxID=3391614 RepID=UPI00398FA14C